MRRDLFTSLAVAAIALLASAPLVSALLASQASAADLYQPVYKALPPQAPPPNGFYAGIEFGAGWSDQAVNYSANDPLAAELLSGAFGIPGQQPLANGYRISQSGLVGGFEGGYNWQPNSHWLLGLETDFSVSGMSGQASGASTIFSSSGTALTQATAVQLDTDWYGTVRGRAGWIPTQNLLLFGTGGFAYGRVASSVNYASQFPFGEVLLPNDIAVVCAANAPCLAGASSAIRTGWTAGGGAEWLLDEHWSAKVEYQFVDLGTETVRVTALVAPPTAPASFNAAFRDQFNVVRLGLNYRF
jgi:outer membrane immunogenic protein